MLFNAAERPASAALIIRYIANRLAELASRNEELLDENISLRTNHKVEEYESRIASLEHRAKAQLSSYACPRANWFLIDSQTPSLVEVLL